MYNISYVDGIYQNYENSKVNINDRGYHFGDSVYEVVLFNEGIFYDFEGHLNRLFDSLSSINIKFSFSKQSLKIIIKNLIKINRVSFGSVYIQVSRGIAERNHSYKDINIKPLLSIIITKKQNNLSDEAIGVKAITLNDNRWARPDIKTTQLLPNVLAKTEANNKGAFEGIFVDSKGYVTEGSSSNIWIINNDNEIISILDKVNDNETFKRAHAERNVLKVLEGDCETAVGAHAVIEGNEIILEAELFSLDGSDRFYEKKSSKIENAKKLGKEVGQILKAKSNNSYKR